MTDNVRNALIALLIAASAFLAVWIVDLNNFIPAPAPSAIVSPSPSAAPSLVPSPTPTPSVSPSPVPSLSPTPVASPSPSPSPSVAPSPIPSVTPSSSPSPSPSVSATPSPSPVPSATAQVTQVLDTFERPEWAQESQWKASATRTLLVGQVTSFVLRSKDSCAVVSTAGLHVILPVNVSKPSAPSYSAGTYYDSLVPLTAQNCQGAKYLQIDVPSTQTAGSQLIAVGDAKITINSIGSAPTNPTVRLHSQLDAWSYLQGLYGTDDGTHYAEVIAAMDVLKAHRIASYKGQPAATSAFPPSKWMAPYSLGGLMYLGWQNYVKPIVGTYGPGWTYSSDEPTDAAALLARLQAIASAAPQAEQMVTTTRKWSSAIDALIKIYTPVAEQFGVNGFPGPSGYIGKYVWLYVSCMSHGCVGGKATLSPDQVIDASAVNQFGFYLMAVKYGINDILYYSVTESWTRNDLLTNPYNPAFDGNGDGLLVYPDKTNKKMLLSIRLKLWREASQFIDRVAAAGLLDKLKLLMTDTLNWDHNIKAYEALDQEAATKL